MSTEQPYCGGCLCGSVRYEVSGSPVAVAHCHCRDCQRWSGAGHATAALYSKALVQATGVLKEFMTKAESGAEVTRSFCPQCGSSVFGRNSKTEALLSIPLGTFDDPSEFRPEVRVFTRSQHPWDKIDDELPSYPDQPAWTPPE